MKCFEIITEVNEFVNNTNQMITEVYYELEGKLLTSLSEYIIGAKVSCSLYGDGKIISTSGTTLDNMIIDIEFAEVNKKFSFSHIMSNKFMKVLDLEDLAEIWNDMFVVHTLMTENYKNFNREQRLAKIEAEKRAEADKIADAKYQKQKEKAITEFDKMATKETELSDIDEFYYSLGWLAKHVGTVTAALPDYLAKSFAKYFGSEVPCRIVDSKKKGPAGYTSQWSWSFTMSLRKPEGIPAFLVKHLSQNGKTVSDTSFVWDLVDNYGFEFGKKQNLDKIKQNVPAKFMSSFDAGYVG